MIAANKFTLGVMFNSPEFKAKVHAIMDAERGAGCPAPQGRLTSSQMAEFDRLLTRAADDGLSHRIQSLFKFVVGYDPDPADHVLLESMSDLKFGVCLSCLASSNLFPAVGSKFMILATVDGKAHVITEDGSCTKWNTNSVTLGSSSKFRYLERAEVDLFIEGVKGALMRE